MSEKIDVFGKKGFHTAPVTLSEANAFVEKHHRHHKPLRFHKFSIGAVRDRNLVGVCIVNRPVNVQSDTGFTLEVARLCTDGTSNACSFLLSKAADAAKALGYKRIQTYILAEEFLASKGASLKAAGWWFSHGSDGGTWNNKKRKRTDKHPTGMKACYAKNLF